MSNDYITIEKQNSIITKQRDLISSLYKLIDQKVDIINHLIKVLEEVGYKYESHIGYFTDYRPSAMNMDMDIEAKSILLIPERKVICTKTELEHYINMIKNEIDKTMKELEEQDDSLNNNIDLRLRKEDIIKPKIDKQKEEEFKKFNKILLSNTFKKLSLLDRVSLIYGTLSYSNIKPNWYLVNQVLSNPYDEYDYNLLNKVYNMDNLETEYFSINNAHEDLGFWRKCQCKTCKKDFYMNYSEVMKYKEVLTKPLPVRCKTCNKFSNRIKFYLSKLFKKGTI